MMLNMGPGREAAPAGSKPSLSKRGVLPYFACGEAPGPFLRDWR
jgi:hypothetical protein